jgi:hypothetical protein
MRRAARWDGWIMGTVNEMSEITHPPENMAVEIAYIFLHCAEKPHYDIALDGVTKAGESGLVREYEQAGATWWFEAIHLSRGRPEELLQRIKAGPPR